jgi:hypothetical protein
MSNNARSRFTARHAGIAARTLLLALLMVAGMSAVAPQAQAGVLWASFGYVSPISWYGPGYYIAPTLVYDYYPYFFGGFPYYGYAFAYTGFYVYSPYYTFPLVWGFWDPPDNGDINAPIEYDAVITGPEINGHATALSGIQATSSVVLGNVDGSLFQGHVIATTLGQLGSLVNSTNVGNLDSLLGASILADPSAPVDLIEYRNIPISQISTAAPEPSSFDVFLGGGLLLAGWAWRKRRPAGQAHR